MTIHTPRLTLIPFTTAILESMQEGQEAFYRETAWHLPEKFTEFPESIEFNLDVIKKQTTTLPWTSYAIIFNSVNTFIGQCGFKEPPDANGYIELGYEIAEEYRLSGFAGEVIKELINLAFSEPAINVIIAHTLPDKNISNHLLIKHGFIFEKTIFDETEGNIWRWSLSRYQYYLSTLAINSSK